MATITVIADPLGAEGWFAVEVNGKTLTDKHGSIRRFRSRAAAIHAGEKSPAAGEVHYPDYKQAITPQ